MAEHGHANEVTERPDELVRVASARSIVATGVGLLLLTALSVATARTDLGASYGIVMIVAIATVQAVLVGLYYMRLRYDRALHTLIVMAALLAVLAFVGFTLLETGQYQPDVLWSGAEPAVIPPLARPGRGLVTEVGCAACAPGAGSCRPRSHDRD